MPTVVRVKNAEGLTMPDLRALVSRALKASLFRVGDTDAVLPEIAAMVNDPAFGVFIAVEGGKFKGIMVIALPRDALLTLPQITIFYSEGTKAVSSALIDAGLEWVVGSGFSRFWAINVTKRSDAVWARAFRKAGAPHRIGSIMEFGIGE